MMPAISAPARLRMHAAVGTGYLTTAVGIVLNISLVPLYVAWLGLENWGVVATNASLVGFVMLLDLGLAQIMPRDIAQSREAGCAPRSVYHSYLRLYLILAAFGITGVFFALPWLLNNWLQRLPMPGEELAPLLLVASLQAAFQLANSANTGYWIGTNQQSKANIRSCFFQILRHVIAIVCLISLGKEPRWYLLSFMAVATAEFLLNYRWLRAELVADKNTDTGSRSLGLAILLKRVLPVTVSILAGLIVCQSDRMILSGVLPAGEFARYVLMLSIGLALYQLQNPITRAFAKEFAIAEQCKSTEDSLLRRYACYAIPLYGVPLTLAVIWAPQLLHLWIPALSTDDGVLSLRILCLAGAINCAYQYFYQRFVAGHDGKSIITVNLASMVVVGLYWIAFWKNISFWSGAFMWLTLSLTQLLVAAVLSWVTKVNRAI